MRDFKTPRKRFMWVRKRIEVTPRHLLLGLGRCFLPGDREKLIDQIAERWQSDESFVCLSVRSGFDLLLQSSGWPEDSEIIMSGLTIPDMPRIVRENRMVPVGVDVELDSVAPQIKRIRRAITPRTRAIVVAHLFGGLCDITPVIQLARQHGLLVIEDCAQAYVGASYQGNPQADISMFSFGPIKTNTALGGAVFRVRNPVVLEKLIEHHQQWRVQSRWSFGKRCVKYAFVKLLSTRVACGSIYRFLHWFGKDHDRLASRMARGFAGPRFFNRIRCQPSTPLLRLLKDKISTYDPQAAVSRGELGKRFIDSVGDQHYVLGARMIRPTFWVLPILVDNPRALVQQMWDAGFDASTNCSLNAICGDHPSVAVFILDHVVFLPFHTGMPQRELDRLAQVVNQYAAQCSHLPLSTETDEVVAGFGPPQVAESESGLTKSAMIGEAS